MDQKVGDLKLSLHDPIHTRDQENESTWSQRIGRLLALFSFLAGCYILLASPRTIFDPLAREQCPSSLSRARRILEHYPLIDGHNDLLIALRGHYGNHIYDNDFRQRFENGSLIGQFDLVKAKEGRYGGAFWSAFWLCPDDIDDFSDGNYAAGRFPLANRSFWRCSTSGKADLIMGSGEGHATAA